MPNPSKPNAPAAPGGQPVKKAKIHPAHTAFKHDGSPDWPGIHAALAHVEQQQKAGHYVITGTASEDDHSDGSTDLVFTIHRVPTDPSVEAAPAPPLPTA